MRRLVVVAISSLSLALLAPAAADAQFGGLVKRAAERVVKKDSPSSSSSSQSPIDDGVVTHMLAGLKEEARVADSVGRASLVQNADAVGQVDGFLKRYAEYATARDASRRAQQEYQACIGGPGAELAAMSQGSGAPPNAMAMAQRMERMSPEEREAFEAKMDKLEQEAKAAEKSGNVAEQQRIRREVQQLTGASMTPAAGVPSQADVRKMQAAGNRMQQCRMPTPYTGQAPEPVMVRPVVIENGVATLAPQATREIHDSTSAQAYLTSLRSMSMGNAPIARGAQAAGMERGRYSLLRERLMYIYAESVMDDAATRPSEFTDDEYAVLESHRGEIVTAARRLKQLGAF